MRRRRRALAAPVRAAAATSLARRLAREPLLWRSRRVACYLASDGEMDLGPLIARLWSMGKRVLLPMIRPDRTLWFLPYAPDTPLACDRFGIVEPEVAARRRCPVNAIDLVLVPLTAFDELGNRLGMGGGYYDRTLARLRLRSRWRKPRLLGVAYAFQRVDSLTAHAWDVPLAGVVTEAGLRLFARHAPPAARAREGRRSSHREEERR